MGSINVTGICIRRDLHKAELTYCELIHVDRLLSYWFVNLWNWIIWNLCEEILNELDQLFFIS